MDNAIDDGQAKGALIHQLAIERAFNGLSKQEKLYAHHMSRAAWHGTRIILRQVSPESIGIFDFIIELYNFCSGQWDDLIDACKIDAQDLESFLEYASTFLSNIGNYSGSGDQKFVPNVSSGAMRALAEATLISKTLFDSIETSLTSKPPYSLGFPSDQAQSAYYPGTQRISRDEIALVSRALEERGIFPENTRIRKTGSIERLVFEVLQASIESSNGDEFDLGAEGIIRIVRGDHADELALICSFLTEASRYAADDTQKQFLSEYVESFTTGSLHAYRDSQRIWIKDKGPRIENIFGFVEPYRDPFGIRAEFEGLVAISDADETKTLALLVEQSDKFIRRLPWADESWTENNGKGAFEKVLFEPPDFTSIHTLAYCSSIIFPGINLPNYNDIRQDCGFKNVIIANRMTAESNKDLTSPFIDPSEAELFQKYKYPTYYWYVVLHELLGHGTGKTMVEEERNKFNFDINNPPRDPVTGESIKSWYKLGQTWTGQFGDLATTVDECRAELVAAYLMDDLELLALFGFPVGGPLDPKEITYNMYLQLGTDGLRGLQNFNIDDGKWGQAHSRAHFAMLKCLLTEGGGVLTVDCDPSNEMLIVKVDRDKIASHGKPALGRMLLRLHMFRCTADVRECRAYYEDLSSVGGEYLEWRKTVLSKTQPKWIYSQPNTFLDGDEVFLRKYPPTSRGIIQSWAERKV